MANRRMNQQQQAAYSAQQQQRRSQQSQKDESVLLCTSGYDRHIRFWEAPTGICNRQIPTGESQVNVLVISPDKKFLAAGGNPTIKLFQINGQNTREPVLTHLLSLSLCSYILAHCPSITLPFNIMNSNAMNVTP